MIAPSLPLRSGGYKNELLIGLNNQGLNEIELDRISENKSTKICILYEGTDKVLFFLFQQLYQFKYNPIELCIGKCDIDYTLCLPFNDLNDNSIITFDDSAKGGAGFNSYLMNCNSLIFRQAICKLGEKDRQRVIAERQIKCNILSYFFKALYRLNINVDTLSNKDIMDALFNHFRDRYPYDFSIVGNDGSWIPGITTELGGTAQAVYERGKGICEGRSKLLKLIANSNELNVPCYLVDGYHGNLGHTWNEFINDDGEILEYDLSFGTKCTLSELYRDYPMYKNLEHEKPIERILKR